MTNKEIKAAAGALRLYLNEGGVYPVSEQQCLEAATRMMQAVYKLRIKSSPTQVQLDKVKRVG